MNKYPINESERIQKLYSYNILDTKGEAPYDNITTLAANICDTSWAFLSLVDKNRQWFKSSHGTDIKETPRDISFCTHVTAEGKYLEVSNALLDERFKNNPLVTDGPKIRFYAGMPLMTEEGLCLGSLCVVGFSPKTLSDSQKQMLNLLAKQAITLFESHKESFELKMSQQEIVRISRASVINEITKNVSHELNNPLTVIKTAVCMIEDTILKSPKVTAIEKTALQKINSAIDRIFKVSSSLSSINQSLNGVLTFVPANEVLTAALATVKQKYGSAGVDFIYEEKNIKGHIPKQVEEVVFHLLRNATKACINSSNPQVTLKAEPFSEHLHIEITDNGPGLPEDLVPRLFGSVIHSPYEGKTVGAGLSICKSIIDSVNGNIRFVKNSPTTFSVNIPFKI